MSRFRTAGDAGIPAERQTFSATAAVTWTARGHAWYFARYPPGGPVGVFVADPHDPDKRTRKTRCFLHPAMCGARDDSAPRGASSVQAATAADTKQIQRPDARMLKDDSLEARRTAAQEAKQKLLEKFKSAAAAADTPEALKRKEERRAIAEAREERLKQREAEKLAKEAERARLLAEKEAARQAEEAARQAQLEAEAEEKKTAANAMAARVIADEAERKAARDAKYAARKARTRTG
jgi:hypothetical protein